MQTKSLFTWGKGDRMIAFSGGESPFSDGRLHFLIIDF
jgi:hypothetical protein